MKFCVLGWSYHKTPIEIRDHIALTPQQQHNLSREITEAIEEIQEILIVSTCNRTEFYIVSHHPVHSCQQLKDKLIEFWNIQELQETAYEIYNLDAVRHLFRVASSLDSMIIGEPQILGQVKEAYQRHLEENFLGKLFNSLFPKAFTTAKRVRTETTISHFAVSISFAAIELAKRIFSDLSEQTVMIIGAGEMAELACKHLIKNGISRLLVTNRTFSNGVALAEKFQGSAIRFEQLADYLNNADIIISSTGSRQYIITPETVRQCLKKRKGRPMFFIDIAVPRDIDPRLNEIHNVYCYDIDDLQNIIDQNRKEREQQSNLAQTIIEEEVNKVFHWFKTLSTIPTIRSLREEFHNIGALELEKSLGKLKKLTPEQRQIVEQLVHNIIHKLLHKPSRNLRSISTRDDINIYLESLNELFELSPVKLTLEDSSYSPSSQLADKQKSQK